ncbi:protein phosphatase 1 regulatory subunit 17 isoform X3 [Pseudopipra pipra]|uniref:protein phosphatase 1 regulatory subunit 17 isoform X3 n=1 Tax=Pseudopipra pipra TaxID=415032 RepID=UPI003139EC74
MIHMVLAGEGEERREEERPHGVLYIWRVQFSLPGRISSQCLPGQSILSDFSDNLLKRYGITEKPQRERVSPVSQITELEQKKPRRKDTPAVHIPPLIMGTKLFTEEERTVIMEDEEKDGDTIHSRQLRTTLVWTSFATVTDPASFMRMQSIRKY